MAETPHRVVDDIADGIAGGATRLVDSAASAVKGAGETLMRALDGPFTSITGKTGPHRMIDLALDGFIDAGTNVIDSGMIGSARIAGKGIMSALDLPSKEIGIPPEIDKMPLFFKK